VAPRYHPGVIWGPFLLALALGIIVSAGLYFAYLWPQVEPDDEVVDAASAGTASAAADKSDSTAEASDDKADAKGDAPPTSADATDTPSESSPA
jgi:hypothetical protein